ncbi:MAG: TolC family outer membrane protein [Rhodospirillaceae bacterium]|nr:TolC family outer membrane protein [Rhodospirillaceae bacterium]
MSSRLPLIAGLYVSFVALNVPAVAAPLQDELSTLLAAHPLVKSAELQIDAADKGYDAAFSAFLPSLDATGSAGYERVTTPSFRATPDGAFETDSQNYSVTLKQNVWDGGGRLSARQATGIQLELAQIGLKNTRQTVMFEGIVAYLNTLRQNELLKLSSQNEQNIRRQLNLEDERVRRGSGIAVDVLQAKSRLQISMERLVAVTGALQDAQSRYLQVFGRGADLPTMSLPAGPMSTLPATVDEAIDAALDENPVVLASNRQIDLANERRDTAEAEYYPSVDVVLLHKQEKDFNGTPGNRRDYSAKVQATWNLFNGLGTSNRVSQAAFDYEARQSEYAQSRRKVEESVRLAWQALKTTEQRVELLENAVNIAAEVFDARQALRESGKETVINVLDAENEVFTARINLVGAQFDYQIAAYQLLQAMGRLELAAVQ